MPRGPGVREIFSSQSMGKKHVDSQESKLHQESKLQKELSPTDSNGPSQMKRFGGYKPKILGGEMDFLQIQDTNTIDVPTPLTSPKVEPKQNTWDMKPQPLSQKPWIVGDKNVPMVLGTTDDDDDDFDADSNNNTEHQAMDSGIYNSIIISDDYNSDIINNSFSHSTSSDTSNLLRQSSQEFPHGITNPVLYESVSTSIDELIMTTTPPETVTDFHDYEVNEIDPDSQGIYEPAGVFIPPPDYEEEEKTLNFNSEDTDHSDGAEDEKRKPTKPKVPVKVYEGADLSHYLSEDEVEQEQVLRNDSKAKNTVGKKSKSATQKPKTLFKQNTSNKNKRKSIGNVPTTNSVRSFSYADSKFGTKGKTITKSLSASNLTDESEIFLSVNSEQSSYESFLRSRHGDHVPYESNNGIDGGTEGDSGPNLRYKDDTVWKKLTMRLRHRVSKSLGSKDQ